MHNIIRGIFIDLFDVIPKRDNMVYISHMLYGQKFKAILLSIVQYIMCPLGRVKRPNELFLIFPNQSTFIFRVLGK